MRHFFSLRANRPLEINGRTYKFTPVSFIAGNFQGVLSVEGQAEIDLLEAVNRRLAVQEISGEEAESLVKKASPTKSSVVSSVSTAKPPRAVAQMSLSPTKQQGVESAPSETPQTESASSGKLPEPHDLIKIERVAPPQMFIEEKDRVGNPIEKKPRKRKT